MSLILTSDERGVKIWRDDKHGFASYSVSFSKKNEDGTYSNCYIPVRFKKGVDIANGTEVIIKNAFPSFNVGKDGRKFPFWMITDYEDMNKPDAIPEHLMAITSLDDEIPFE